MTPTGIAVVTSGFPRRSETFVLNELLALEAAGALAAIFATKPGDGSPLHPGCASLLSRLRVLSPGSPQAQAESLVAALGRRRIAGVHGYFAHHPAAVAAHAARRLGVPYGFGVHARDARKLAPRVLAARARRAAWVLACNGDVAREVRQIGASVEVVPHGVDTCRFRPRPVPADEPLRLLAVGRLVEKKGFETLVAAVARLRLPFRLRIVGEGARRRRLERAVVRLGLGQAVELAGPCTHAELPREYARAHVVVVPSVEDRRGDRDGLPNVVLEALASGRVVVASDVGAVASAVVPGRTGLLVPPGDADALAAALETLARRPRWRAALGRGGRAWVERHFDLGRCTARFRQVLERAYG